jgi:hypothetical protein
MQMATKDSCLVHSDRSHTRGGACHSTKPAKEHTHDWFVIKFNMHCMKDVYMHLSTTCLVSCAILLADRVRCVRSELRKDMGPMIAS